MSQRRPRPVAGVNYTKNWTVNAAPGDYRLTLWYLSPTGTWTNVDYGTAVLTVTSPVTGAFTSPLASAIWPISSSQTVSWHLDAAVATGTFYVWAINQGTGAWYDVTSAAAVGGQVDYPHELDGQRAGGELQPDTVAPEHHGTVHQPRGLGRHIDSALRLSAGSTAAGAVPCTAPAAPSLSGDSPALGCAGASVVVVLAARRLATFRIRLRPVPLSGQYGVTKTRQMSKSISVIRGRTGMEHSFAGL